MLPISDRLSPEPPPLKRSKSPDFVDRKTQFSSQGYAIFFHNPRTWLLALLLLQILLILMGRSFPFSSTVLPRRTQDLPSPHASAAVDHLPSPSNSSVASAGDAECPDGRVYVYELPEEFNAGLIQDCHRLSPWSSRCDALSNEGFGRPATNLAGIVPDSLVPAWYWTDQFVSEILYHNRMVRHRCRTREAESAAAFYIPFYAGLAVGKYLWSESSPRDRDRRCEALLGWVRDQPHWNRSDGWDHFITLGRISWDFRRSKDGDWGSSFIYMPAMRNVTRLLIERNPWDYFDVGVPYPTGFHPRSAADVSGWQQYVYSRRRTALFSFAGAPRAGMRNDFRALLMGHCRNESSSAGGSCRVVDCSGTRCANGTASSVILEAFLDSDFCLQPRGDSFSRRSIFDCMVAGSIPVFFWQRSAYFQYEWFLPADRGSYSVFIDRNEVKAGKSIRAVLESYSREEVRKMREKVIEFIPKFVYARNQEGLGTIKDAFDVALEGVLRRVKEQENGYKWR